ncbi:MAG: NUDIX hydrolase [Candidatus Baltobacteraceae bacterium]
MLARPGAAGGIEILMVRRSARSAFAPDAFVFPGGTVDAQDYRPTLAWNDARIAAEFRATFSSALPSSEDAVQNDAARALVNAAVRELREEADIAIPAGDLHLFSHWITPPTEPRRYNTHFFIAQATGAHIGVADSVETHDARWIAPARALALHRAEQMHLVYPTIKHLERLRAFAAIDELMRFTRSKPIVTIMPGAAPHEGFVMPPSLEGAW